MSSVPAMLHPIGLREVRGDLPTHVGVGPLSVNSGWPRVCGDRPMKRVQYGRPPTSSPGAFSMGGLGFRLNLHSTHQKPPGGNAPGGFLMSACRKGPLVLLWPTTEGSVLPKGG